MQKEKFVEDVEMMNLIKRRKGKELWTLFEDD